MARNKTVPDSVRVEILFRKVNRRIVVAALGAIIAAVLVARGSVDGVFAFEIVALIAVLLLYHALIPVVVTTELDKRRPLSVRDVSTWSGDDLTIWTPLEGEWRKPTGLRCIELLKRELTTVEEHLAELHSLELRYLHGREATFTMIQRRSRGEATVLDWIVFECEQWAVKRAYTSVKEHCAGDLERARTLVRRIESIWSGDVQSEIRDREDEMWQLKRNRSEADPEGWLYRERMRKLDERIRSIEREITELKERQRADPKAREKSADEEFFERKRLKRRLDILDDIYEEFEHQVIRDTELFKAMERLCREIEMDRDLGADEKRRQQRLIEEKYALMTGTQVDSIYES